MAYDNETLINIFRKTDGHCHLCGKKLRLFMYNGYPDGAAWEVEHSVPKAKGGTDHFNNLFPAHIVCNREKGIRHTRTVRKWFGRSSAPLSKAKKDQNRTDNTLGGVAAVALILEQSVNLIFKSIIKHFTFSFMSILLDISFSLIYITQTMIKI